MHLNMVSCLASRPHLHPDLALRSGSKRRQGQQHHSDAATADRMLHQLDQHDAAASQSGSGTISYAWDYHRGVALGTPPSPVPSPLPDPPNSVSGNVRRGDVNMFGKGASADVPTTVRIGAATTAHLEGSLRSAESFSYLEVRGKRLKLGPKLHHRFGGVESTM